ncbi:bifunctional UDP-sugar hydrolase/5'-nucleotidase [uncultured Ruminococcus sp.]|uniref:bifunctional metallophosphatase/5'-nucleotidase n=1 Tax=uncultured Ruminococcus sp. TaxID=165186 RepID=UPI0025EE96BD|nr:bifunctional UDP-sugar hydrolase/5'-nucleotidase [uncultured Ruminococcus sp.]
MKNTLKKLTSVLLGATLAVSGTVCAFATDSDDTTDFCVKIVHTNDIHARVEENAKSSIIGMPKLKTLIDSFTESSDMDLVVDSGDLFHGQSIATLVQGESIAELVKACGYDAMTAGNHDWNYGKDRLKELAKIADVEMLTGNVVDESGEQFFDNEYYVETTSKDGQELKVGIFGVIDPDIYSKTAGTNVEGLTFTDSAEYAIMAADELEEMGCDVVIALTHTYDPVSLASKVDGVDLWLAGHEHVDIDSEVTTPDGSKSRVIENGYYLYEAGLIDLDCSLDSDGEVVSIDINADKADYSAAQNLEENAEVKAVLDNIKSEQSVILNEVVGSTPQDLDGVWEDLRIDETNLGRAVTDAYLLETGADIAFENAGGIRASVKKGELTYGDIIGISPFGNYIVTKQITGKQLVEILETSIDIQKKSIAANDSGEYDAWPENSGSYLQTGGITVEYNLDLDYGKRVISVKVGNEPLDDNKLYTVATNNFVAVNENYPQLANAEETGEYSACDEALIKYFSQSEDVILKSVTTPRMIKTSATEPTTEPTQPETEPTTATEPTEPATSSTDPTSATGTTSATQNSTESNNGAVKTGVAEVAGTVVFILLISALSAYVFSRRKRS